uniref:Uncharacterized protein n=1 Tax=Acrobeloides nanus TaxID=290746 RepID=A0A914EJM3_9BILA
MEAARERMPGKCSIDEFNCLIDGTCIPLIKFHDCILDCLDGSDEYCFPGHIKCGDFCVELKDFGECLLKPRCGILNAPKYCMKLNSKLCLNSDTLPCKGYGECIFVNWVKDGKHDCYDGSDEDPEYVKILQKIKEGREKQASNSLDQYSATETIQ